MDLIFTVRGQSLAATLPAALVGESVGYLRAVFRFSPDWKDTDKWLHLRDEAGNDYQLHVENDVVEPLNLTAGRWEGWLHGIGLTDGAPELRITTTAVTFQVSHPGALEGEPFPEILPTAAEQIAANSAMAVEESRALRREVEALMLRAGEVEESANAAAGHAQEAELAKEQAIAAAQSVHDDAQSAQQSSVQAREAREDAQALSEHTELYMTAAQTAAQSAETARLQAQESAGEVDGVVTAAQNAANASEQSAGAAQNAAARAEGAAQSAQTSQSGAATAAANAAESEVCAQVAEYNAKVYAEGGNLRQVDSEGNIVTLPETTVGAKQYAESIVVPTGDGAGTALLLTAPGGTVYRITVSDSGALSAAAQS